MKKKARQKLQVDGGAQVEGVDLELFSLDNIKTKKVRGSWPSPLDNNNNDFDFHVKL